MLQTHCVTANGTTTGRTEPKAARLASPAGKLSVHSPHTPLPSTSALNSANAPSLFNAQQYAGMHTSPPMLQAMANTLFSQNAFFNTSALPFSTFASPTELSRIQQWFQHCSPYSSPCQSTTPSLVSNLSGLSILSGGSDSAVTLNSQQLNKKAAELAIESKEEPEKQLVDFLRDFPKETDPDLITKSLDVINKFTKAVVKKSLSIGQKNFQVIINVSINRLAVETDHRIISHLLSNLCSLSSTAQFKTVVHERSVELLRSFVELFVRVAQIVEKGNGDDHRSKALSHLLMILVGKLLPEVKDKSEARKKSVFDTLLLVLRFRSTTTRYLALGMLRSLLARSDEWKKFAVDQHLIQLVLDVISSENGDQKLIRQSIRTLDTVVCSADGQFAEKFVQMHGIERIIRRMGSCSSVSEEDFRLVLNLLRNVSDVPAMARVDLSQAIPFALRGTILSLTTLNHAMEFLSNAIALNEQARNLLAGIDGGRAVRHFIDIAQQCFEASIPLDRLPKELVGEKQAEVDTQKMMRLARPILEYTLATLALLNKEMAVDGSLSQEQQTASKLLASNEVAMYIYQLVLKMDVTTQAKKYQKSVLMSLDRTTKAGALPAVATHGLHLAQTLLNFVFNRVDSDDIGKLMLMRLAAEVLCRLVVEPGRLHLSTIAPLLSSGAFQPFDLLQAVSNNSDFYTTVLKLTRELCKREPTLRALWSTHTSVNFLNCLMAASSNNSETANLCAEMLEMLQMGEDTSESAFSDAITRFSFVDL